MRGLIDKLVLVVRDCGSYYTGTVQWCVAFEWRDRPGVGSGGSNKVGFAGLAEKKGGEPCLWINLDLVTTFQLLDSQEPEDDAQTSGRLLVVDSWGRKNTDPGSEGGKDSE